MMPTSFSVRVATALAITILCTAASAVDGDAKSHSLVGDWTGDAREGCSEQIAFSAEGAIRVNSREEVLVGTYKTESIPESATTLKVTRTITSSNGAPACSGKVGNEVGKTRTAYAIWENEAEMSLCFDPRGARCFGRFKKK